MGPKLLFCLGIVAAHGALAAAWVEKETAPRFRDPIVSCARSPAALPDFTPRRELLAMTMRVEPESMQP